MNRLGNIATLLALAGLAAAGPAFGQTFSSDKAEFRLDMVAEGLEHPWSLAFLPDGSQLVTEREDRLRRIENGELQDKPIAGVPELVVSGQGGLLDVILHPDFENNRTLFLSYAHKISRNGLTTRVARATLDGDRLSEVEVIFEALPEATPAVILRAAWNLIAMAICTSRWATGVKWIVPRPPMTMPAAFTA